MQRRAFLRTVGAGLGTIDAILLYDMRREARSVAGAYAALVARVGPPGRAWPSSNSHIERRVTGAELCEPHSSRRKNTRMMEFPDPN